MEDVSFAYVGAGTASYGMSGTGAASSGTSAAGSSLSGMSGAGTASSGISDARDVSGSKASSKEDIDHREKDYGLDYVLEDSSFKAGPGEIIGLVGPSGGGKTTMIRLMLGLIHPLSGRVLLFGPDGREVPANADTRRLIAYVPQGNTLLSGTIADNLQMAREEASEEEMIGALKIACAWDFIERLPQGLQTSVGERGKGFSEGQAQRIAIARAVLRDAPILLFDEATSSLDEETEKKVLANIITHYPNKTCIVTTHRPAVLSICHKIYRVEGKTLKE